MLWHWNFEKEKGLQKVSNTTNIHITHYLGFYDIDIKRRIYKTWFPNKHVSFLFLYWYIKRIWNDIQWIFIPRPTWDILKVLFLLFSQDITTKTNPRITNIFDTVQFRLQCHINKVSFWRIKLLMGISKVYDRYLKPLNFVYLTK